MIGKRRNGNKEWEGREGRDEKKRKEGRMGLTRKVGVRRRSKRM